MWRFYLLSCAGAFRARSLQVYVIVFQKDGNVSLHNRSRPNVLGNLA